MSDSYRSSKPSVSHAVHRGRSGRGGDVEVDACGSAGNAHGGGQDAFTRSKVEAMRSLKPREKDGGNVEYMWVWNARVYAESSVAPSLR